MSGIAGIVRCGDAVRKDELAAMLRPMTERGPDRQSLRCEANAGFGQALLATTREACAETQPWVHPDSGCVVVSDSRLDNRPQLLRELGIDRPADEVGDGELLHAAWQRWKEGCADRLRGDFVFALWDARQQELYIARDPMGMRPLLYHFQPGRLLVFASSTEAVLAQGEVPTELDEGRIADTLISETEGIDKVCTLFRAVQRLPPAHWMRMRQGALTQQLYWEPLDSRPNGLPADTADWIEAQREQLDRAVRLRLRSHRPVGSMLSGGLDSSSVVALASNAYAKAGERAFPIFSAVNSTDPGCIETRHIRAVIDHVRCHPTLVDLREFKKSRDQARFWWDRAVEPFDCHMTLVAPLYAAAARDGVVSVMDGIPADNLYSTGRYVKNLFERGRWSDAWRAAAEQSSLSWVRLPRLNTLWVMGGCLVPESGHGLRRWWQDRREYHRLLDSSPISQELIKRTQLWRRYRRFSTSIGGSHQWHASGEATSTLTAPYITAGIERYNRVASLFGVEPRSPFADRDLIEFQAWMPVALREQQGHAKWVLRQAMSAQLPAEVIWRTDKSHIGYRFTEAMWEYARQTGLIPEMTDASVYLAAQPSGQQAQANAKSDNAQMSAAFLELWLRRISELTCARA